MQDGFLVLFTNEFIRQYSSFRFQSKVEIIAHLVLFAHTKREVKSKISSLEVNQLILRNPVYSFSLHIRT